MKFKNTIETEIELMKSVTYNIIYSMKPINGLKLTIK